MTPNPPAKCGIHLIPHWETAKKIHSLIYTMDWDWLYRHWLYRHSRLELVCVCVCSCSLTHVLCLIPLMHTQDMMLKCNEEEKSLSSETFGKVSFTNLRRQAVPDLASDLGNSILKKVGPRIIVLNFPRD